MKSEQINELAAALAKAQGQMTAAAKDSTNPHFKVQYADLASVWDAIRGPLSANGLAVVQIASAGEGQAHIETTLMHSSGQFIGGRLSMASGTTPQQIGSAITYARRYALSSIVGIAPDDDDGNAAQDAKPQARKAPEAKPHPDLDAGQFAARLPTWAKLVENGKGETPAGPQMAEKLIESLPYKFSDEQKVQIRALAKSEALEGEIV